MNDKNMISDEEIEIITIQILKFFHDDPLTQEELSEQVWKAINWAHLSALNYTMLDLVIKGELTIGYARDTGELSFKKLSEKIKNEKAKIVEDSDEDLENRDPADWWKV